MTSSTSSVSCPVELTTILRPRWSGGTPSREAPKSNTWVLVSQREVIRNGHHYLNIRHAVSLNSCHASPVIKLDLPHAAKICQKILDELARLDIPHLQRAV